jgi:predicted RNA-binding protein with TRAM domain
LSATPGDGSGSISFTAGADGGASISNYEYQLDGGSWTALSPADATSPVTIPGLTNGTTYTVKLRAVNSAGSGAASDASGSFTPATTPDAPTSLSATPGDGSASIAFTAGADGGASISNYEYQLDGGSWTALSPADGTSPVTIPGLTNGTTYSVKLRAVNTAGAGTASSAVSVEPAPTGPSSCSMWGVGKYSIQTCWNPLVPAQGKVNRYRAYVFTAGTTTKLASCKGSAADTGCVVKGAGKLSAATDYDVVVRARVQIAPHQVFWSLYSAPVRVSTNP